MVAFRLATAAVLAICLTSVTASGMDSAYGKRQGAFGLGNHQQFITGPCKSSADCDVDGTKGNEACCARVEGQTDAGVCSGICVSTAVGTKKQGCGFGDPSPPKVPKGKCDDQQKVIDDAFSKAALTSTPPAATATSTTASSCATAAA